jgi:hypothetical protein
MDLLDGSGSGLSVTVKVSVGWRKEYHKMEDHVIWDEIEDMQMLESGRAGMSIVGQLDEVQKETKQGPTSPPRSTSTPMPLGYLQERNDKTNRRELS